MSGQSARPFSESSSAERFSVAALLTLALLSSVAPFGIDLYLPAFPAMVVDLHTTTTGVQLSLTAFLIGAGTGQLMFGPWSDRVGRYGPLLTGLGIYIVASVVAFTAPTIEVLVVARLVQGLSGAAGMVLGRAMVLDRAHGAEAARIINIMMVIGGAAPVVAPLVGSALSEAIGWRGLLIIVASLGVVSLFATLSFLRETRPYEVRIARPPRSKGNGAAKVLLERRFIGFTLAYAFLTSGLLAYVSSSPFIYQEMIGFTPGQFGIAFAVNSIGVALFNALSARLAGRVDLRMLLLAGLILTAIAGLAILVLTLYAAPPVALLVPLFFVVAPCGLVFGNATVLALDQVPRHIMGLASAVLGALQFGMSGIAAALVGLGGEHSSLPLGIAMVVCSTVALTGFALAYRDPHTNAVNSEQ
ncbi:MAG: multidrug effflux MFS transporter [Leucobacter sp.]